MKAAFLLLFAFASLPACPPDAGAGRVYLITELELLIIENYKANSEREKQAWLSQVKELKTAAGKSAEKLKNLENLSAGLNLQLEEARERGRKLELLFNEYEAGQSALISSKNGEIAGLKQKLAGQALETERYKGRSRARLITAAALAGAWAAFFAFKVCRFSRLFP
ncbi:MAG: hypothetical protein LBP76_02135 [Treponema sp.]|jgi:hypothetical protein|nr:hypothetical protein [Treponema sp.]